MTALQLLLSDTQLDEITAALGKLRRSAKTVTLPRDAAEAMLVDYGRLCAAVPHDVPIHGGPKLTITELRRGDRLSTDPLLMLRRRSPR